MKKIFVLMVIFCLGCDVITTVFNGNVKINRQNGSVTSIEVTLPMSTTLTDRKTANAMIDQLNSMLNDLKAARDQFPVEETEIPQ